MLRAIYHHRVKFILNFSLSTYIVNCRPTQYLSTDSIGICVYTPRSLTTDTSGKKGDSTNVHDVHNWHRYKMQITYSYILSENDKKTRQIYHLLWSADSFHIYKCPYSLYKRNLFKLYVFREPVNFILKPLLCVCPVILNVFNNILRYTVCLIDAYVIVFMLTNAGLFLCNCCRHL